MIITVIAMGMMKMTVDQIVYVVAMRDLLVATVRAVDVVRIVTGAAMSRRAPVGVIG